MRGGDIMDYYSLYSQDELSNMSKDDVEYVLGYGYINDILRPPRCKKCGEFTYLDFTMGYSICDYCNSISKFYINSTQNIFKNWNDVK